jgi:hypothetical protein
MARKFNPAAHDKHAAANPRNAALADRDAGAELEAGLIGSFPASDAVSAVQPAPSRPHREGATHRSHNRSHDRNVTGARR